MVHCELLWDEATTTWQVHNRSLTGSAKVSIVLQGNARKKKTTVEVGDLETTGIGVLLMYLMNLP